MTSKANQSPQYLNQYDLKVAPFRLSPDPHFFYPSPTHLAAERILMHAIASGEGFMVLTGRAGLGKTLILRRIIASFEKNKVPILILSPAVDPVGLLQLLLGEMEVVYDSRDSLAILLQLFQNHVLHLAEHQQELFIIVDEAQNMQIQTLEQLRMLSNLETGSRKLMQILLVGQTEMEEVLTHPELGQLVQRIVVHERLEPLNREQIIQYVGYRLNKAGRGDIQLTKGGSKILEQGSLGIPRLINRIMDRTLLLASVEKVTVLTKNHVESAISTMKDIHESRRRGSKKKISLLISSLLVLAGLMTYFFYLSPLSNIYPERILSLFSQITNGGQPR